MKHLTGGVCAPKGFVASGTSCGIRKTGKKDLALIVSQKRAAAAGVYTQNLVKGAPILVTQKHLANGYARAIIANSGNANTCNANGIEIAEGMCELVEKYTGIYASDVIVASTGVIGQRLSLDPIANGMSALMMGLGSNSSDAAEAILTTDTVRKEAAVSLELGGKTVKIGAIAKGSGMIHPNMATLLVFTTTDAAVAPALLQKALELAIQDSFNMISIDRDTSTNDTAVILANGMAENAEIGSENADFAAFLAALKALYIHLSRLISKDGEGATKLLECRVTGARTDADARVAAKSVICSPLLKCAMFGSDANWGRVLCALGYAGADIDVAGVDVTFKSEAGEIKVCENGGGIAFSEEAAKTVLSAPEIEIAVSLGGGPGEALAFGCDLTYDYVKINSDYRS
ncbi:MAG: bifunctional glutamate N-acetyltransferase/amino-acid acetyltransferase ArgJ [Oscillospiraceae bacterium]|jgi:glutamate N-acetyltransferase/amino-acid N-acetyltransferase|nr:bifunctional glutamate N-acetyltransferase/amino-acid acetyltransferase ArgJ [Oscillospiraceae bacterium]